MLNNGITISNGDEPIEATLVFREQADGRSVARLPGGKVVLIDLLELPRVKDGERWRVRLRHRDTFAIAEPLERIPDLANPVLPAALSATFTPAAAPGRRVEASHAPTPAPKAVNHLAPAAPGVARSGESALPVKSAESLPFHRTPPLEPAGVVRSTDRVALFVDGANMDGACRSAGYFVDYRKAREFVVAGGIFYAGYYYLADFTASDPLQQRFMDFLANAGFIVRRRPVKVIKDYETGEKFIKGNLDTEIVLDMLNSVQNYDVAFLFSGDSDFERALDLLRSRGKRVYIVTARPALSRELLYVADKPIFHIEDFRSILMRDDRTMPSGEG